jgi:hypothetical protein
MLEKIYKYLLSFLIKKHFVFRSRYYEENIVINDTNIIEYHFINVSDLSVWVNDLELLPVVFGSPDKLHEIKLSVNYNEEDTTIYRVKVAEEFGACTKTGEAQFTIPDFFDATEPTDCIWQMNVILGVNVIAIMPMIQRFYTAGTILTALNLALTLPPPATFVVNYVGSDLVINITNVTLACGDSTQMFIQLIELPSPAPICPLFAGSQTMDAFVNNPQSVKRGKLLAIFKMKAGLLPNP